MATKRETLNHGKKCWEVDFGVDLTGARRRKFFPTEDKADGAIDAYHKDHKRYGEFWARLPTIERQRVVTALQDIKAAGQSIDSVWADWKRWKEHNKQEVTTPMGYAKVVLEWGRRKRAAGKTERYVFHAEADLMKFGEGREEQPIHKIEPAELEAYIDAQKTWGLSSKRTNMALFSSLWRVAVAKGWAAFNIVDRLEPVGKIGRKVEIYPNETSVNLMAAIMENNVTQSAIAPVSLGLFGCMRPEEIQSAKPINEGLPKEKWFGWHDIDLKHGLVTVRVEVAKTGDQRVIRLQPAALAWLKLAKKLGNELPCENETKVVNQCCELINLENWIRDGLRKNCATHLRAVYKNDYDVVKDMGNSVRILLKYYADLHTPEAISLDHWKITPEKIEEYRKTKGWEEFLREAATRRVEQQVKETASTQELSANGTARRVR